MAECVKSLVTKWLWPRIKCHLDYWWCFCDNVQGLNDEIGLLEREKCNMDQKIEQARLRAESLTTEVQGWFEVGDQELMEGKRILRGCDGLRAWNIGSRYSWGKRAKKITEGIAKLRNEANEIRISDPAPPPAMAPIPHKPIMEFESRKDIEEDIMEFLRDDRTCMIAICGAGGVGKTTMVHRIEDRVRKENLFDEVVCVVVSQQFDLLKIQEEISEFLGLAFSEKTLAARAHKLRIRLQDSKRKLIIFDDVWESFNLEDIGVPIENGFTKCKIILTSRITDACNKMGAKIIRMELLKEEEAWALFEEKAGSCVEGSDLRPIAENVVAECKRLPVAIVTVGVALKDQSIDVWKDSLSQLRISMPIDIYDVIKDVYKPLKLSYDFLENESAKSFFLLCCMFREDYNIPMEHLTLYGFGLGMFQGIRNIEEGRSRTRSVVEKLKNRFLLLDGDGGHSVKMHDVVRDVAIFIGSKEKDGFLMNSLEAFSMDSSSKDSCRKCNWMSIDISTENSELPIGSDFPNLRFMMIRVPNKEGDDNNVICFERMQGLKVLSLSDVYLLSLPSTMELLKELRTLRLENCLVKDISVFGELACLEILCISRCDNIEELPTDIRRLNFLRLLELNGCIRLRRIVAGVISSLVRLEELKIVRCFDKWEAKGNQSEERNAGLSELESLPNLTSLEIEIPDCNLLAEEIGLSQKLVRYKIRFGGHYVSEKYERGIGLHLPGDITVGNWIRQLARSTQSLALRGELSTQFPVKLAELEEIIYGTIPKVSNFIQKLESISIENLPKLAHLWKSQNQNDSLGNLKSIYINRCPNLCYLFSVATARSLVQLEDLEIKYCDKIEQVLWNGMESNTDAAIIEFPNLRRLTLSKLPNLAAFSQGVESIEFPKLVMIWIVNLPRLKSLLPWDLEATHDDHHSLFGAKNVSLGNLISIDISRCPNLCYLFSVATARSLVQLEHLDIRNCDKIEQVFCNEMESNTYPSIIEFPNLRKLTLIELPNLAAFSQGVESIEFPKLEEIWILNLPRLKSLLPWDLEGTHDHHSPYLFCNPKNVSLGNLKSISISGCPNLCYLFSVATARSLVQLEHLIISDGERRIIFPELKILQLRNLPCVSTICRGVESIEFPKLEKMVIGNLPRLKSLLPWDLLEPTHDDHHSLHFFCNPKVEFPRLKELHLFELPDTISKIWCRRVPINFFHNLERLYIVDVNGISNLISSSMSKNLVNLWYLSIERCQDLVDVIEDEKEASAMTLFRNLKELSIKTLDKLRSFCQWKHALELPSLKEVKIVDCSVMETFTLGSLSTPCLSHFTIDGKKVETKDLNGCIRDQFKIKIEDENKDEDDEHENSS